MTTPFASKHFARLMEVLRPAGGIMVIVEGYFDESGDPDVEPGIFCLAGYFISADAAKVMDEEWGRVLAEHNIPYFHMVDCAHGNGIFADMPLEERVEVVKQLIVLIKKYTEEGVGFLSKADSYDPPKNDAPNQYTYLASMCVDAIKMYLKMNRIEAGISYFFEDGHKSKKSAYMHIAQNVKREDDSLTFAAKDKIHLLQAADLLAWQCAKYAKDYSFARWSGGTPKRSPRKDFMSLMEHDHSFMYLGSGSSIGIELWPMEKRSQSTVNVSPAYDGPISYWMEEGEEIPIIPVERSLGWRMGGARFAYLAFNGFEDKKFALAFGHLEEPIQFGVTGKKTGNFASVRAD